MYRFIHSLHIVALFVLAFYFAPTPVAHAQLVEAPYQNAAGYTVFTPSLDTQIIYVSSSEGDNSNDGLSEENPVATIAYGKTLLRPGYPDWLLLKKGDTWQEVLGGLSNENAVIGRSADEPVLISSYGSGARPILEFNGGAGFIVLGTDTMANYVAIVGLEFYNAEKDPLSPTYDPDTDKAGVSILSEVDWFLVEDNVFRFLEAVFFSYTGGYVSNLGIRKNLFRDVYSTNSFSSCLFTAGTLNLLVEDNIFDNCGWNGDVPGAEATGFNRAAYLCCGDGNTIYRGNIDFNGSSGGVQLRTGGILEDSLFLQSPIAISVGSSQNPTTSTVPAIIRNNVILDSRDIGSEQRGFGIWLTSSEVGEENGGGPSYLENVEVYNNIISSNVSGTGNVVGITIGGDGAILGLSVRDNIIYDWREPDLTNNYASALGFSNTSLDSENIVFSDNYFLQPRGGYLVTMSNYDSSRITFSGNTYWSASAEGGQYANAWFELNGGVYNYTDWVSNTGETDSTRELTEFVDADRSIATYMTSIGIGGGIDEFMNRVRQQSSDTYDERFTSYAVNQYIRDGFALAGAEPTPAPVLTFEVSSSSITEGGSTTLTWSTTNATSCTASNGWTGAQATASSTSVSPSVTTTYTLTCTGDGGSDEESVVVTVTAAPEPEPSEPGRSPSPLNIYQIHSGHSLTDTIFQGSWPGLIISLISAVDSSAVIWDYPNANIAKSTVPGSSMAYRWTNPPGYDAPDARHDIANYQVLSITENNFIAPEALYPTGWAVDFRNERRADFSLWVNHALENGNGGDGAEVFLYTNWPAFGDFAPSANWRERLDDNEVEWLANADNAQALAPSGTEIFIIPGNMLMMQLWDDAEAGLIPDMASGDDWMNSARWWEDDVHPASLGGLALAYLHVAVIHHLDPRDLPYTGLGLQITPTEDEAEYIQNLVWGLATSYDRTGVAGSQGAEPTPAPVLTFEVSSSSITEGGSTTLTWSTTNATSCTASNGWTGAQATASSTSVSPSVTTTYTLTCTGDGGSDVESVIVTVTPASEPTPAPVLTFEVSTSSITAGSSTTLTWSTTNATSCTASNGWSGARATAGSLLISPTVTTTYTLTCTGDGGSDIESVVVTVTAAPDPTPAPVLTFEVSSSSITEGGSTTLTWSTTNATSCTASNGWSGVRATSGSLLVSPSVTTTYTLTCTGAGGSDIESVVVTVTAVPVVTPPSVPPSSGGGGGGGGSRSSAGAVFSANERVFLLSTQAVRDLSRQVTLGTQATSSAGKIVSRTTRVRSGVTYYQVAFDNGLTGWVDRSSLSKNQFGLMTTVQSPAVVPTSGQVRAKNALNIRMAPNGRIIGTEQAGSVGTIESVIKPEFKDGYTWVYVQFGPVGGFVAQEFLEAVLPPGGDRDAILLAQIQLLIAEVQRLMKILAAMKGL